MVKRPLFWAFAWLGWFLVLAFLSSLSQPGPKIDIIGFDKVLHTVYFMVGGTCLALCLALRTACANSPPFAPPRWGCLAVVVVLTGAAVGWLDEWHQSSTPGRNGLDVYDWLADVLGSVLALPMARGIFRRLSPPPRA